MMIQEIASSSKLPPLKRPRFTCDDCILNHDISSLPNQSFFLAITGPARSGKTSTATSLLTTKGVYRNAFEQILLVIPPNSLSSLEERHPFHRLEQSNIFPDLEHIDTIYHMIQSTSSAINERTGTRERSLLFIDDMASQLKDAHIRRTLLTIVNNRRHLRCSIILITQYLNSIPLAVRRNISHLIAYRPHSKKESQILFDELLTIDKHLVPALLAHVFRQRHDFLYLDIANDKVYRNFILLSWQKDGSQHQTEGSKA
jgi:hypothetical protein